VVSSGTDNAIFRLGERMSVRLPRYPAATAQVEKEARWLPVLAPNLPLAVPAPLAIGSPNDEYPWQWCVSPWIEGEEATIDRIADSSEAARTLAAFIAALQRCDASGGPPPGPANFSRGAPIAHRDGAVRKAIAALGDRIDGAAATAAWEAALAAPVYDGPPVWLHGDLQSGNILVHEGRLAAVIDFGCLGVGDPACELMPAWTIFSGESRAVFRAATMADDAAWERGRGWALSSALIALPYYMETNPVMVRNAWHALGEVLTDSG
jgi:aminoglycoside phosphotransferase (APT) family kinase protein